MQCNESQKKAIKEEEEKIEKFKEKILHDFGRTLFESRFHYSIFLIHYSNHENKLEFSFPYTTTTEKCFFFFHSFFWLLMPDAR